MIILVLGQNYIDEEFWWGPTHIRNQRYTRNTILHNISSSNLLFYIILHLDNIVLVPKCRMRDDVGSELVVRFYGTTISCANVKYKYKHIQYHELARQTTTEIASK